MFAYEGSEMLRYVKIDGANEVEEKKHNGDAKTASYF